MKFVEHTFAANETIEGAIRLHNGHHMSAKVAELFMRFYNQKNGVENVPKPGDTVLIPVDERIARLKQ